MEDLLQLPEASKESVKHINTLLCAVAVSVNVFKALGRLVDQWDDFWSALSTANWLRSPDLHGLSKWERTSRQLFQNFRIHRLFWRSVCRPYSQLRRSQAKLLLQRKSNLCGPRKQLQIQRLRRWKNPISLVHIVVSYISFAFCNKFSNCLNSSHTIGACNSQGRCNICKEKHNTKLHDSFQSTANRSAASTSIHHTLAAKSADQPKQINVRNKLLTSACVVLQSKTGQAVTVRALLDPCVRGVCFRVCRSDAHAYKTHRC